MRVDLVRSNSINNLFILEVVIKTVDYFCFAKSDSCSDSPEYSKKHDQMNEHLKLVISLPVLVQERFIVYISQIMQTLHMSVEDYESALKETIKNNLPGKIDFRCFGSCGFFWF